MPKVRFGLKNVHYAIITETSSGPTWGTPKAMPGAVSLDLEQEGSRDTFNADNMPYYVSFSNRGYTGSLELARVDKEALKDIWGFTETTSGALFEDANVEPKEFALLYQTDTDDGATGITLYRCVADRPNIGSSTIEDTKTPQTQTINISAIPIVGGALDGKTKVSTENTSLLATWFSAVFTG